MLEVFPPMGIDGIDHNEGLGVAGTQMSPMMKMLLRQPAILSIYCIHQQCLCHQGPERRGPFLLSNFSQIQQADSNL